MKNPDEVERTAQRDGRAGVQDRPAGGFAGANADKKYAADPNGAYKDSGPSVYCGAELKGAQAAYGQAATPNRFSDQGPAKFGKLTSENLGKLLGIFLDKKFVSTRRSKA